MMRCVPFALSLLLVAALAPGMCWADVQADVAQSPARYYASPNGDDDAEASLSVPGSFTRALARAIVSVDSGQPAEVLLAPGVYGIQDLVVLKELGLENGSVSLRIAARDGAPGVVFDGGITIDATRFVPLADPAELQRVPVDAGSKIVVQTLDDPALIEALRRTLVLPLVIDGEAYLPSRFPNSGYATLAADTVEPEIAPPAVPEGKSGYGIRAGHAPHQEPGRPAGWLGTMEEPRGAWVRIDGRDSERAGSWRQWEAELASNNARNQLTGFLDANWLRRSQGVVAASASREAMHLSQALAYGWSWRQEGKPFFLHGLLCELDAPGEWHFDPGTNRLYLYPPRPLGVNTRMLVPVANGFLRLKDCHWVRVEGIAVRNVASGTLIEVSGGSHNTVAGVELSRSTALGVSLSGRYNSLVSSDLFDLNQHVRLDGGTRDRGALVASHNRVENCHIHQRNLRDQRVGIGIRGVGNVFRNNLVHDSLGQPITVRGNDHLVERNEIFNVGYDEGDGGAIYSGGDLTGYGVTYRHNFIHHLMHRPGKVERSGIHLDDLQAGSVCEGNVFFKSAGKGIFMNGGAGHRILGNVFIEGYRGVYNVGAGAARNHARQEAIRQDPNHDYRGKKEDYVGNAERVVGPDGWNQEPWVTRYPTFSIVMNDADEHGRLWPIRCVVRGNVYCGNAARDATIWSRVSPEAAAKSVIEDDVVVSLDVFRNPAALDFSFIGDRADVPQIPFGEIGLYTDEFRASRPDPQDYRRAMRAQYEGIPCMPGTDTLVNSSRFVDGASRISD